MTDLGGGILDPRRTVEPWGAMEWLADDSISAGTGLSLARMTIRAGQTSPTHSHPDCTEIIHVLDGAIEARLGDTVTRLRPGQTCLVPPGTVHAATATGPGDAALIVAYSAGARTYDPA